jgi:hypothetical protein
MSAAALGFTMNGGGDGGSGAQPAGRSAAEALFGPANGTSPERKSQSNRSPSRSDSDDDITDESAGGGGGGGGRGGADDCTGPGADNAKLSMSTLSHLHTLAVRCCVPCSPLV